MTVQTPRLFVAVTILLFLGGDTIVGRTTTSSSRIIVVVHGLAPPPLPILSIPTALDTLTSGLASIVRLPRGVIVAPNAKANQTVRLVEWNDIENSRPHRRVRERITELDLVIEKVVPNPTTQGKNDPPPELVVTIQASNGSDGAKEKKKTLAGEENIVAFLDQSFTTTAGAAATIVDDSSVDVKEMLLDLIDITTNYLAGWMRVGRGRHISPAVTALPTVQRPEKVLILYSYEGNQFCRLVREVLTELDLPYELRSAGKESPRRTELASISGGSTQCPFLVDPNTGTQMAESKDIIQYLYDTYALWTPPNELLEWISDNVMPTVKPVFAVLAPLQAGAGGAEDDTTSRSQYRNDLTQAMQSIRDETSSASVVVYTYALSPFSFETKALLDSIKVKYKEISLGKEWIPGLIDPDDGAIKRAALLEMTGQSSLPQIFINGKPIGGLFSGQPGLFPLMKQGKFMDMLKETDAISSAGVSE